MLHDVSELAQLCSLVLHEQSADSAGRQVVQQVAGLTNLTHLDVDHDHHRWVDGRRLLSCQTLTKLVSLRMRYTEISAVLLAVHPHVTELQCANLLLPPVGSAVRVASLKNLVCGEVGPGITRHIADYLVPAAFALILPGVTRLICENDMARSLPQQQLDDWYLRVWPDGPGATMEKLAVVGMCSETMAQHVSRCSTAALSALMCSVEGLVPFRPFTELHGRTLRKIQIEPTSNADLEELARSCPLMTEVLCYLLSTSTALVDDAGFLTLATTTRH